MRLKKTIAIKKIFLTLISLLFIANVFAGGKLKYDKETGIVSNETGSLFKVSKLKSKTLYGCEDYYIQNLEGKDLIFVKTREYSDPNEGKSANTNGNVLYREITFLNTNSITEVSYYFMKSIKNIEFVYEDKLIADGDLDNNAVERFIRQNGMPHTKRQNEINNRNDVIIINNTAPAAPQPKNGVNINLNGTIPR
ncbi:MAG: hypothetical protein J0M08_00140 [Bacteroidetes bacterium]|nr:hypothetical protein [Bacteroidota bacterium]